MSNILKMTESERYPTTRNASATLSQPPNIKTPNTAQKLHEVSNSPTTPTRAIHSDCSIQTHLTEIQNELKCRIRSEELKGLVRDIVTELFDKHQEKIEKKLNEKLSKVKHENQSL